jgi:hypothetical protein
MDEFTTALVQRMRMARAAMEEAAAEHDFCAVSLTLDEWEDALLLARHNGVEVPPVEADQIELERARG